MVAAVKDIFVNVERELLLDGFDVFGRLGGADRGGGAGEKGRKGGGAIALSLRLTMHNRLPIRA